MANQNPPTALFVMNRGKDPESLDRVIAETQFADKTVLLDQSMQVLEEFAAEENNLDGYDSDGEL